MKKIGVILVILLGILVAMIAMRNQKVMVTNTGPIVAFGDSLIQGIGATAGNTLPEQISELINQPVLNLGVSGNTSAQGLSRISDIPTNASLVILSLGGNDILRKVPLTETEENLDLITKTLTDNGSVVLLLDIRAPVFGRPYKQLYQRVAAGNDQVLLAENVFEGVIGNQALMSDPIHPNDAGYQIMAERINAVIRNQTNLLN